MRYGKSPVLAMFAMLALVIPTFVVGPSPSQAQGDSRTFPETGKTIKGRFFTYRNEHGGLAQQGFPISEEMQDVSDTDGQAHIVQYFERAIFELYPLH